MSENKETDARNWYHLDAKGKVLGRLATEIANLLRGKDKTNFAANLDQGDYVVVTNADAFVLTGKKVDQKRYYRHTGYLGNLKTYTVPELLKDKPGEILTKAVEGMLPHNRLQKGFMDRLKVYSSDSHPHQNIKFKNVK
ncbi:MAG: 50S ribosomal protein L13 [Candidatus Berkelbacteria bacterium]|nr:50S ribosomal protein L13 [Candidatus Berkelbacteria bacterium]